MKKCYLIFYVLTFVLIVVWAIYSFFFVQRVSQPNYSSTTEEGLLFALQPLGIGICYFVGFLLEGRYKKIKIKSES